MQSLGELPTESRARERVRIVQPVVIMVCMVAFGFGVVQMVLNTKPRRLARASKASDAVASMHYDQKRSWNELLARGLTVMSNLRPGEPVRALLPSTARENLQQYLHEHLSEKIPSPEIEEVGVLNFKGTEYVEGRNLVTEQRFTAETSATEKTLLPK
jgi:hypothetical protein